MRFILTIVLIGLSLYAQTAPQEGLREKTPQLVALENAAIVVRPGQVLQKATLLIRNGRIAALGEKIEIPEGAVRRDLAGLTIYPGFIEAYSSYGIPTAKKQTAGSWPPPPQTTDKRTGSVHWNPAVHPETQAAELFTADSKAAQELRSQGITVAQTARLDGIFRGESAVVLLRQGLANELIIQRGSAQFVSFRKGSSKHAYPGSLMGSIALIRQTLYDAQWYDKAHQAYQLQPAQKHPEVNHALAALTPVISGKKPIVFATEDELSLLRAAKIAAEFKLAFHYLGSGNEYRRIDTITGLAATLLIPVNFPETPAVDDPLYAADVTLAQLKHWDIAPENAARLEQAGCTFALTSHGLKNNGEFLVRVRQAIERGLSQEKALAALTTVPARLCGIDEIAGTLEQGKLANFLVVRGNIFTADSKLHEVWVAGEDFEVSPIDAVDPRGTWKWQWNEQELSLEIGGELPTLQTQITIAEKTAKATKSALQQQRLQLLFPGEELGLNGIFRLTGRIHGESIEGVGISGDGQEFPWNATRSKPWQGSEPKQPETKTDKSASFAVTYPDKAFGRLVPVQQSPLVVVKNATIWTCGTAGILKNADMIVRDGKIAAVGVGLAVPEGAVVIDGSGKHLAPGIVDEHSHIAIYQGVNEATQAVTAEVRIGDVVNSDSIQIYRQLAGGVTTSHLLHGSANPIGGQSQVIKLRWGKLPEEMKFDHAPPSIKFALGENVKQSNWGDNYTSRYPQTRMGVQEIFRDTFQAAREYHKKWQAFDALSPEEQQRTVPPRRDLELDAIVEILHSKRFIHCHSYVQSEIRALARLANQFGFSVGTFTHVLEGYKVAREIKESGAMASSFSDWWAYKFEVYDAIPYNGALMHREGVVTSFNSDSAEMARRLNQEAAKAVKYGGVPEHEALQFVTLNPARQLYVDDRIGSLEVGKDGDFVLWNGHPLSNFSRALQTWIEGCKYFDIEEDAKLRRQLREQRTALVQKALQKGKGKEVEGEKAPQTKSPKEYHCDDITDFMKGGE